MKPADINAVADRLAAAVEQGDVETVRDVYSPALTFTLYTDGVPHDREAAVAAFAHFRRHMQDVTLEVFDRQLTVDGFVSQQRLHFTAPDGQRMQVPHCLIARVDGARITRIDEYLDSQALAPLLSQIAPSAQP